MSVRCRRRCARLGRGCPFRLLFGLRFSSLATHAPQDAKHVTVSSRSVQITRLYVWACATNSLFDDDHARAQTPHGAHPLLVLFVDRSDERAVRIGTNEAVTSARDDAEIVANDVGREILHRPRRADRHHGGAENAEDRIVGARGGVPSFECGHLLVFRAVRPEPRVDGRGARAPFPLCIDRCVCRRNKKGARRAVPLQPTTSTISAALRLCGEPVAASARRWACSGGGGGLCTPAGGG